MNNIFLKNLNKNILSKYDNSFNANLLFEFELLNENLSYKLHKSKRFFIDKETLNNPYYIYISYIETNNTLDGVLLTVNDYKIYLIKLSDEVYYLANINNHKINNLTLSILYTFISDNNCVLDVTKYKYAFKNISIPINLYK